jgi:hypothetical protein
MSGIDDGYMTLMVPAEIWEIMQGKYMRNVPCCKRLTISSKGAWLLAEFFGDRVVYKPNAICVFPCIRKYRPIPSAPRIYIRIRNQQSLGD